MLPGKVASAAGTAAWVDLFAFCWDRLYAPSRRTTMQHLALKWTSTVALVGLLATSLSAQLPDPLPRPDGKKADMSKPVHVYILMGQSNMLGFGKVAGLKDACVNKGLYPYLINDDGSWTVRKDVRFTRVMCSGPGPRLSLIHI